MGSRRGGEDVGCWPSSWFARKEEGKEYGVMWDHAIHVCHGKHMGGGHGLGGASVVWLGWVD